MERIAKALGVTDKDKRVGGADSFVDRLSCSYTVTMLMLLAFGITFKQWLGDVPISCWCPPHFTGTHEDFTNNVCYTKDTYFLPLSEQHIPQEKHKKMYIGYYQWVALVLICQAALFHAPRILWRLLNKKSGICVNTITDAAIECQKSRETKSRKDIMEYMVNRFSRFLYELSRREALAKNQFHGLWIYLGGNYLVISYVIVKIIYLVNVMGQIFWLNIFLGMNYHMYGVRVLDKMWKGQSWSTSERFPRVTLCDFSIRTLGNIQNYTVQCSLPMNLFNEKIYILIWFWFAFVAIATIGSMFSWVFVIFYDQSHLYYVKTRLLALDRIKPSQGRYVKRFVTHFLRSDGIFIIRLVAKNCSNIIATELLGCIWEKYVTDYKDLYHLNCAKDDDKNLLHGNRSPDEKRDDDPQDNDNDDDDDDDGEKQSSDNGKVYVSFARPEDQSDIRDLVKKKKERRERKMKEKGF